MSITARTTTPKKTKIGIVGAGVMGRVAALELLERGYSVTLYDQGPLQGTQSCSYAAGGMLSPYCELEACEPLIARLGIQSLELWPEILRGLHQASSDKPVFFQKAGSLVVAHPQDAHELGRLKAKVQAAGNPLEEVAESTLRQLEPDLDRRFFHGLYFPEEGQLSARETLVGLGEHLVYLGRQGKHDKLGRMGNRGCEIHWNEPITSLASHSIISSQGENLFDWVIDTRGLGASQDLRDLRGVRGELIRVRAPEVKIRRPVRLMHPRFPLYIIPRPENEYLIGATSLETDHRDPISVRSTLELLSGAYSMHSGFGNAGVLETVVQVRPAFPHNRPKILYQKGLIRINGLYRHGFLISPQLARLLGEFLDQGKIESCPEYSSLFEDEN